MAIIEDKEIKNKLLARLRTVKGHIGGIERMIEEDKDCVDLLIQISAIKASINKIGLSLIESNICQCIAGSIQEEEVEEVVKDAVETILKFTK